MKRHISLACVLMLYPTLCLGETAIRWTDSNGRIIYGSKPPPGAKKVEQIKAKSFSKYSSKRLLSGYRAQLGSAPSPSFSVSEKDLVGQEPLEIHHPEGDGVENLPPESPAMDEATDERTTDTPPALE